MFDEFISVSCVLGRTTTNTLPSMDNTSYYWDVIFESYRQFFLSWIYDLPTSDIQVLRGVRNGNKYTLK